MEKKNIAVANTGQGWHEVEVLDQHKNETKVKFADGERKWISSDKIVMGISDIEIAKYILAIRIETSSLRARLDGLSAKHNRLGEAVRDNRKGLLSRKYRKKLKIFNALFLPPW